MSCTPLNQLLMIPPGQEYVETNNTQNPVHRFNHCLTAQGLCRAPHPIHFVLCPPYCLTHDSMPRHHSLSLPLYHCQLGISAPQGCGKSTLVEQLAALMAWLGVSAASVSIDDFYLSREEQAALAAAQPDNRLLALRGNAGSHDLGLGKDTLAALRGCTAAGHRVPVPRCVCMLCWLWRAPCCRCMCASVLLPEHCLLIFPAASDDTRSNTVECTLTRTLPLRAPRYDKSAFSGLGDRAAPDTWPAVEGPLEVVFFEGWMSGFSPIGREAAAAVEPALAEVDDRLGAYKAAWDDQVDAWLVIRIADPQVGKERGGWVDGCVERWRRRYV